MPHSSQQVRNQQDHRLAHAPKGKHDEAVPPCTCTSPHPETEGEQKGLLPHRPDEAWPLGVATYRLPTKMSQLSLERVVWSDEKMFRISTSVQNRHNDKVWVMDILCMQLGGRALRALLRGERSQGGHKCLHPDPGPVPAPDGQ
eukprot:5425780-Amphidinium_carterae.1